MSAITAASLFVQAFNIVEAESYSTPTVTVHATTGSAVSAVGTRTRDLHEIDFDPHDLALMLDRLATLLDGPKTGVLTIHHATPLSEAIGWAWEITATGFPPVPAEALYWWLPGLDLELPKVDMALTGQFDAPPSIAVTDRCAAVLTARGLVLDTGFPQEAEEYPHSIERFARAAAARLGHGWQAHAGYWGVSATLTTPAGADVARVGVDDEGDLYVEATPSGSRTYPGLDTELLPAHLDDVAAAIAKAVRVADSLPRQ